jgi:hypothetical protein
MTVPGGALTRAPGRLGMGIWECGCARRDSGRGGVRAGWTTLRSAGVRRLRAGPGGGRRAAAPGAGRRQGSRQPPRPGRSGPRCSRPLRSPAHGHRAHPPLRYRPRGGAAGGPARGPGHRPGPAERGRPRSDPRIGAWRRVRRLDSEGAERPGARPRPVYLPLASRRPAPGPPPPGRGGPGAAASAVPRPRAGASPLPAGCRKSLRSPRRPSPFTRNPS